jgi:uncharacterized protein (TIGR02145 family)
MPNRLKQTIKTKQKQDMANNRLKQLLCTAIQHHQTSNITGLKIIKQSIRTITFLLLAVIHPQCHTHQEVTDIDGNTYKTVTIGSQTWMAENLRVTRYRNGDAIPITTDSITWGTLSQGACCAYRNNMLLVSEYGLLYNHHAITDTRGLAPKGWRLPTQEDWNLLIQELGGDNKAGSIMKQGAKHYWLGNNTHNEITTGGFRALPSGYRHYEKGEFFTLGSNAYFWAIDDSFELYHWSDRVYSGFANPQLTNAHMQCGLAVRCIKN